VNLLPTATARRALDWDESPCGLRAGYRATAKARGVLPATVALADAVFNTGRAALRVAALTQSRHELTGWRRTGCINCIAPLMRASTHCCRH
jgi:hypothetical protein